MRELQRDPAALRRIFVDEALVDFLHIDPADPDERADWIYRAQVRGGFSRALHGVLDRMEAWRGTSPPSQTSAGISPTPSRPGSSASARAPKGGCGPASGTATRS